MADIFRRHGNAYRQTHDLASNEIAFHNKTVVYCLLFRAAAETPRTIGADPRHLGAELGVVAVLVPTLAPGGIVILDNLGRHKSARPSGRQSGSALCQCTDW